MAAAAKVTFLVLMAGADAVQKVTNAAEQGGRAAAEAFLLVQTNQHGVTRLISLQDSVIELSDNKTIWTTVRKVSAKDTLTISEMGPQDACNTLSGADKDKIFTDADERMRLSKADLRQPLTTGFPV